MPQNAFFLWSHDLLVSQKITQRRFFSTLPPLSLVNFATATVVAFALLHTSRFNFHCYTQCEAVPAQKSAWKWCCDLSQLLARKITKGIHSRKPASLNLPIDDLFSRLLEERSCSNIKNTLAGKEFNVNGWKQKIERKRESDQWNFSTSVIGRKRSQIRSLKFAYPYNWKERESGQIIKICPPM